MHSPATATHAVLLRAGRPHRVAPLTDWRAMADFRAAASLSIGLYSVEHVDAAAAQTAEDTIAGARADYALIASWPVAA